MVKIEKIEGLTSKGNHSKKRQIILTHTRRNIRDYIVGIKTRLNGEYTHIPHFIIDRDGKIFQLLEQNSYSEYMDVSSINKNSVIISLENLGWLRKNPLSGHYINWIGDVYKGKIFEKKWRGHFFWQPYTIKQINSLKKLTKKLCEEMGIPFHSIGHNVKVDKVENFNGIVSCSNFDAESTDVNPAFNFDIFIKKD